MTEKVNPIPEGFNTLTPYIIVNDGVKAIQFYEKAFGAHETYRSKMPNGKIMHARLKIGNSMLMLSDEFPHSEGCGMKAPASLKGTTTTLNLYVEDVDALFLKAVNAGAKVLMPLENMFWGDRYGQVEDPFGHIWSLGTRIKNMTNEEIEEAAAAFFSSGSEQS
ncbi:MAG: VOC family protein [Candidatus Protochlamydia sp.]|nr:VOC family protein [Candidatus Protochlamydia sp.]